MTSAYREAKGHLEKWWGEAPKRPYRNTGVLDDFLPNGVATPKDAPSRGGALHPGSARFPAYWLLCVNRNISRFGPIIGPFGSLAPPKVEPWPSAITRLGAFSGLLVLCVNRNISRSGPIIRSFGSLALPRMRAFAASPPRRHAPFALSPLRPRAMLFPYDDPSRCN